MPDRILTQTIDKVVSSSKKKKKILLNSIFKLDRAVWASKTFGYANSSENLLYYFLLVCYLEFQYKMFA